MKQYRKQLLSSVKIRVTVPGFIFSNIEKYEGNNANESSAEPLTLLSAHSLARHALSYDILIPYLILISCIISLGL